MGIIVFAVMTAVCAILILHAAGPFYRYLCGRERQPRDEERLLSCLIGCFGALVIVPLLIEECREASSSPFPEAQDPLHRPHDPSSLHGIPWAQEVLMAGEVYQTLSSFPLSRACWSSTVRPFNGSEAVDALFRERPAACFLAERSETGLTFREIEVPETD